MIIRLKVDQLKTWIRPANKALNISNMSGLDPLQATGFRAGKVRPRLLDHASYKECP
jgi:hypothetical protein